MEDLALLLLSEERMEMIDSADNLTEQSFESPESSLVAGAVYHPRQQVLYVTLHTKEGDRTFGYAPVHASLWEAFSTSPSKGAFFSKHIRSMFVGKVKT